MEEVSCPVATAPKKGGGGKKRFELKKWQAVAMWTWGGSPPAPPCPPPCGGPSPLRPGATRRGRRGRPAGADGRRGATDDVDRYPVDMDVDNCAICRNHIMELCIECQVSPVGPDRRGRRTPRLTRGARPRPGDGDRDHRPDAGGVHGGLGGVQPRVPLPLHLAVAQDPAGVPAVQRGMGVPEVRPVSRERTEAEAGAPAGAPAGAS